jgi:hypothetical protein
MNALPVPFYGQSHAHLPVHSPEGLLDVETRQRILRELSQMWTRFTGQPEEELLVSLWENPAENAMEGGSDSRKISQE